MVKSRFPYGVAAALVLLAAAPSAQDAGGHLSSVVDKLSRGERVFGVSTYDLSLENARSLARADVDYVYVDMEHGPMDFTALHAFLLGLTDKQAIAASGSLRQRVTPLVRIAPYGREPFAWAVKQALDVGVMGIIFPAIETPEQALAAVRAMRYPQRRDSAFPEPPGLRGSGPGIAAWFWGLSGADYARRADLWPLDPRGNLVALMMIESAAGVENAAEIAAVPGVAGFYVGPSDLSNSLGLPRGDPEVEAAIRTIVDACVARNVACGITAGAADMPRRIAQGFPHPRRRPRRRRTHRRQRRRGAGRPRRRAGLTSGHPCRHGAAQPARNPARSTAAPPRYTSTMRCEWATSSSGFASRTMKSARAPGVRRPVSSSPRRSAARLVAATTASIGRNPAATISSSSRCAEKPWK